MAVCSLYFTSPKLQTLTPKPTFKASLTPFINKKQIFQVGVGILAASIVTSTPLNADATRIEYYATTAEPTCEFNYVRSGLGYCDIAVGSGQEAPYNQLVNIHYTARFADGIVFDSSYKRGRALTMRLGMGKGTAIFLEMQHLYMTSNSLNSTQETGNCDMMRNLKLKHN